MNIKYVATAGLELPALKMTSQFVVGQNVNLKLSTLHNSDAYQVSPMYIVFK